MEWLHDVFAVSYANEQSAVRSRDPPAYCAVSWRKATLLSFTAWYWTAVTVLFSVYYTEAFMSLLLRLARAVRLGRTALVFRILLGQLPSKFEAL